MSRPIIRRLKPEEEELLRKREEFAAVRGALAEGEMELLDLRNQLAAFEGRYLRQVGTLYAELAANGPLLQKPWPYSYRPTSTSVHRASRTSESLSTKVCGGYSAPIGDQPQCQLTSLGSFTAALTAQAAMLASRGTLPTKPLPT
jgi:hypothetical protein